MSRASAPQTTRAPAVAPRKTARPAAPNPEAQRLAEDARRERNWERFGPYLAERQWGTVREDYSPGGECWTYFPHDHARSRAYRWGEDGLLGFSDRECRLCFALALWNGRDPILKERLFGLVNSEGNHGEDVKEEYFYLDSTPTHSYCKALYKYPQREYPYAWLVDENRRRGPQQPEFELRDTGAFNENRYFDVFAEYAKATPDDTLIRITIANRGPETARIHVLPTLWFRNTWSWGPIADMTRTRPSLRAADAHALIAHHETLGNFRFAIDPACGTPAWLFTENNTNNQRLFGAPNETPCVKDAFHDYVVHNRRDAVSPDDAGTKAAPCYVLEVPAGGQVELRARLFRDDEPPAQWFGDAFDAVFSDRRREADTFYEQRIGCPPEDEHHRIARQAYAGMLWSKQFYYYFVRDWLQGDPGTVRPPDARKWGRNRDWQHFNARFVLSMPDKWEYPWFAAWDLAFHTIPLASVDVHFAQEQLTRLLREWYMHPNGQIPAYEFAFGDVNPPVHAWAVWRVYKRTGPPGKRDTAWLASCFHKLLVNYTWWVNRKDPEGRNVFAGGFLGMDNIGAFDRSQLPPHAQMTQADGTAWMAFYSVTMLTIAFELSRAQPEYQDMASKFFEHFMTITEAMNTLGGCGLWDEQDGFYYDQMQVDGRTTVLKCRSMVGLIPLIAVAISQDEIVDQLPGFKQRLQWFVHHRPDITDVTHCMEKRDNGRGGHHFLLSIPSRERLARILRYMLDENEFLSPHGIRAVSKFHEKNPFRTWIAGQEYTLDYVPGESLTGMFGGNSNWRGPVWFPVNYLLVDALHHYHEFYGDDFKVECPTGSGRWMNLGQVADELTRRLASIFMRGPDGHRPVHGGDERYARDAHYRDLLLFYEYFHGDTGRGVGASHQTGWTGLVIPLVERLKDAHSFHSQH
ncbi:MAG: glucosidase [Phycisphaerae bacterium]|nr:glucosidase [Phycisphaerae bacterium]MCZ2400865.1 glucosidase [Phycisphaerae bacterium]NUQ48784.1 glucosidase [Phycisphaerae bacterium]